MENPPLTVQLLIHSFNHSSKLDWIQTTATSSCISSSKIEIQFHLKLIKCRSFISKMEPLATNKRLLILFSGYYSKDNIPKWRQRANAFFTFTVFAAIIYGIIVSAAFFLKYVSIDLERSLYAIIQISAMSSAVYTIVFVLFSRRRITTVLDDLAEIYRESETVHLNQNHNFSLKNKIHKTQLMICAFVQMKMMQHSRCWCKWTTRANGCGKVTSNSFLADTLSAKLRRQRFLFSLVY